SDSSSNASATSSSTSGGRARSVRPRLTAVTEKPRSTASDTQAELIVPVPPMNSRLPSTSAEVSSHDGVNGSKSGTSEDDESEAEDRTRSRGARPRGGDRRCRRRADRPLEVGLELG